MHTLKEMINPCTQKRLTVNKQQPPKNTLNSPKSPISPNAVFGMFRCFWRVFQPCAFGAFGGCLRILVGVFLCVFLLTAPSHATPAISIGGQEETTTPKVQDSFGRESPRGTVQGFLAALASGDEALAAKYLDDDYLAQKKVKASTVIADFKKSLDVGGRLDPALQISDLPTGDLADLLPPDEDKVGTIAIDGNKLDVLVVKKTQKDGGVYWQFSKRTLSGLPKISADTPAAPIEKLSVPALKETHLFGYNLSDVAALVLLVAISLVFCYVLVWLSFHVSRLVFPVVSRRQFRVTPTVIMPLSLVLLSLILPEVMLRAGVPVILRTPVERLKEVVAWLATAWLALRLIDAVFRRAEAKSLQRQRPEHVSFLGLFRKLAKVFMLFLALIVVFGNLGFDLTTGIAALGVGGLALAFGAQKTIENLIGSVVVVADRPVRVGDYCKFGAYEGVVIDIGIRSTRVRTLNRTVVTIPNGEFSSLQIENYATRDMFHFLHALYVKKDTPPDLLATLLERIKAFLDADSDVNDEWTQVRISELRHDAIVVEVRAYIITKNVVEFYDKQSRLIIDLLRQVENLGVEHALPAQDVKVTLSNTSAPTE